MLLLPPQLLIHASKDPAVTAVAEHGEANPMLVVAVVQDAPMQDVLAVLACTATATTQVGNFSEMSVVVVTSRTT